MIPDDWTKKRSDKCNCGGHQGDIVSLTGTSALEKDDGGETILHNHHGDGVHIRRMFCAGI
jgi:hypothetical protein